jgi:hypothetical protein
LKPPKINIEQGGKEMESNGNSRGALLTAGGVLSILGGVLEVIGGGIVTGIAIHIIIRGTFWPLHIPWVPWGEIGIDFFPAIFIVAGIVILVLGAIGIAGGISALNRKSFGLSLAGAICILPTILLGILAIIFVSVSRREF